MPEVSDVKTVAEDVVDLTVKPEQPATEEESATLELQQPAAEEAEAEMTLQKAEEKVEGEAPKITATPQPKVIEEGQTAVFECEATGEPVPEVQSFSQSLDTFTPAHLFILFLMQHVQRNIIKYSKDINKTKHSISV